MVMICALQSVTTSVLYGGVPMACILHDSYLWVEYRFGLQNPPSGTQVVSGVFSEEIVCSVRLFDDAWLRGKGE
jgi:hypothetical protein